MKEFGPGSASLASPSLDLPMIKHHSIVMDPGFPREARTPNLGRECKPIIWLFLPENCLKLKKKKECFPVGCVPPACCPYLPASTAHGGTAPSLGGVPGPGGYLVPGCGVCGPWGVTTRGCTWSSGVYLVWGCIWSWGCTCPGEYLVQEGVPGPGEGV